MRLMCRALSVSESGDYDWRTRAASKQAQARAELDAQVKAEFEVRKGRAGAPRLGAPPQAWRAPGGSSLRRQGLRAKAAKKFKATTNSNHTLPVAENLLQQNFSAQRPNQVGVGDTTFIGTGEG